MGQPRFDYQEALRFLRASVEALWSLASGLLLILISDLILSLPSDLFTCSSSPVSVQERSYQIRGQFARRFFDRLVERFPLWSQVSGLRCLD